MVLHGSGVIVESGAFGFSLALHARLREFFSTRSDVAATLGPRAPVRGPLGPSWPDGLAVGQVLPLCGGGFVSAAGGGLAVSGVVGPVLSSLSERILMQVGVRAKVTTLGCLAGDRAGAARPRVAAPYVPDEILTAWCAYICVLFGCLTVEISTTALLEFLFSTFYFASKAHSS